MTDIDLKRLAVDRAYWDECATWRGARYYCANSGRFNTPHEWPCDRCIPRPTKQEWDGGLPPNHGGLACTSGGKCKVLGWDSEREQVAVQWHDGELGVVPLAALKPLKTQQDRQREELALCLQNDIEAITGNKFCDEDAELLADNLLFKGWTKEPKP